MSKLSKSELQNLATLSRLTLNDDAATKLEHDLENILKMVEQIQEVNTDNVKTMAHPLDMKQTLREDVSHENPIKHELQSLTQNIEDDMYIVPKVID